MVRATTYRPEFEAALRLLARFSAEMNDAEYCPPFFVGGGGISARALYALCEGLDIDYMQRRIAAETAGSHGLQDLKDPA